MLEAIPCVSNVPGVCLADVIGDQERGCREAQVGEDGVGVLRQRFVTVVEGQQEPRSRVVCRAWEFIQ